MEYQFKEETGRDRCKGRSAQSRRDRNANQNPSDRLRFSSHAARRICQRGLSIEDIGYVVSHGQKHHAADAIIYFLRDKDMPVKERRTHDRLCGTAVVMSRSEPLVITVWRNRQRGLQNIKRKPVSGWRYEAATSIQQISDAVCE